jgi:asparagine synthase (glutamine-hydrolysing)
MSGIAGIHSFDGQSVNPDTVRKMVDILAHRGPDGSDIWCEGAIGLGHRMLWSTPESLLEKLPFINHAGNLVITTDARIDNRDELINALALTDLPREKITDSHLILAAYEKWGNQCPEYLLGDFAFAIWNRELSQLFCARDHFGVKPFYYFLSDQTFIFASEIKAIINLPGVPRHINELRIADYLTAMLEDKSITAYQGILRLPPAYILMVDCLGKVKLKSYWSLDPTRKITLNSDEEYADVFRALLTEAVRCRLRSAFPVGSHLSGGLDSSSVTCVARELLTSENKLLHTFSNVFDDIPECDERAYIQPILDQGNLIPHYVHPDQQGALSEWQYFFPNDEEPCLIGGNGFLILGLNRAAYNQGVRVVLDGFDGDTTLSHATGYFIELAHQRQWQTFFQEATAVAQQAQISPNLLLCRDGLPYLKELAKQGQWLEFVQSVHQTSKYFNLSRKYLVWQYGLKPIVPKMVISSWRSLRRHPSQMHPSSPDKANAQFIHPDFAQRIGIDQRLHEFNDLQSPKFTVKDWHWQKLNSGGMVQVLEHSDLNAAACGIEIRHPFMDKRLIEFCLALPSSQKLQQGWSRIVMRRAMEGLLPKAVQWRWGKTNMTPNFLYGLLKFNRELLDETVLKYLGSIQEYVDLQRLHTSYTQLISGGTLDEDIAVVWTGIGLALWLTHTQK